MIFATATSGLLHQQQRLEASAHNSANLGTRQTVVLAVSGREIPSAGVQSTVSATPVVRPQISAPSATTQEATPETTEATPGPTGFVDEAVEQITIHHHSVALVKALQTQDDMLGSLLDVLG
jgi:flagellar basal body rod protein FlgG